MRCATVWLLVAGLQANPLQDESFSSCEDGLCQEGLWLEESDDEAVAQNMQLLQMDLSLHLQRPIPGGAGKATEETAASRLAEAVLQPWKADLDQQTLRAEGAAVASLLESAAESLAGDAHNESAGSERRWPILGTHALGQYTRSVRAPDMKWAVASLGFLLFATLGMLVLGVWICRSSGRKGAESCSFSLKVSVTVFLLALFAGAAWLAAWYYAGAVLKYWLERMDTSWVGVEVTSDAMSLNPFVGRLIVANLTLGNPPGYTSSRMLVADSVLIDISMRELVKSLGHRLSIQELKISDVEVTYEQALSSANVRDFLGRIDPNLGPHPPPPGNGSGPPWQVDFRLHQVMVSNIWAKATLSIMGNNGISLLVPNITWRDFDNDVKARAGNEIISIVLGSILDSVTRVVGLHLL
eukprot:gb/GFBE01078265.1/.p1 GENE.gb/GFBE01078265.1/~~gb/GFBE01078265.1/.p1  ORF type:complete len:412 (+),score=69.25 gb/GFBE01078265.1/:1-1236(+)